MPNTPGFDTAAMAAAITAAQESGGPIVDTANPSPDNGVPPGFDTTALLSGDPNGTVQIAGEGAGGVALSAPPPQPAQPSAPEPAPYVAPDPSDPALHQQGRQMGTPQPADDGPTMEPFDPYLGDPNQQPAPTPQPEPAAPVVEPDTDSAVDTDTGHFDPSRVYELVLGHAPTADEVVQTVSLASRFASLTPEQQQWVDGIMGGRIDPRQIEAQLQAAQQQAQQPAPRPQRDPYADDPYTDPTPDPALEAERAAIAREREQFQAQQQQWEQQRIAHDQAEAQRALNDFRTKYADWAPEELAALEARVNQSAVWGGIYSSTGDAYSATAQTIQLEALSHDHFRAKLLGAAATSPDPTADDVARATAAAALAGNGAGGGARPTGPSAPPSPTDPRLSQVGVPQGYSAPVQQPVQPVHSALTQPTQTAGPDLNNRNEVALAMAAQIAQMVGDR